MHLLDEVREALVRSFLCSNEVVNHMHVNCFLVKLISRSFDIYLQQSLVFLIQFEVVTELLQDVADFVVCGCQFDIVDLKHLDVVSELIQREISELFIFLLLVLHDHHVLCHFHFVPVHLEHAIVNLLLNLSF